MNIAKDTLNEQVLLLTNSIAPIEERIEKKQPEGCLKVIPSKFLKFYFLRCVLTF